MGKTDFLQDIKISIIIPAINEGPRINDLLEDLKNKFAQENLEIIVVDGNKNGSTINRIEDNSVTGLVSNPGRAVQMNNGASAAKGDILLFLHADTFLPRGGIRLIKNVIVNEKKPAGCFDLRIKSRNLVLKIISYTASLRSRITRLPYGDQALFFSRDFFQYLGGFREIPIMEDIEIMQRIKRRGVSVRFISKPVITSERRWRKEGILFGMIRNPILVIFFYLGVPPEKLVKYYR